MLNKRKIFVLLDRTAKRRYDRQGANITHAAVVELADTRDLKSLGSNTIPVRARSAAPKIPRSVASGNFCIQKPGREPEVRLVSAPRARSAIGRRNLCTRAQRASRCPVSGTRKRWGRKSLPFFAYKNPGENRRFD